jgi:hypothetical protein
MSSGPPSDQSSAAQGDSDLDNGGGFFRLRHDDPDRADLEAQHAERIRARFGDDAFRRMDRSRALTRTPRPLTDQEAGVLRAAVAPLLRDMEASGQALPDFREEAHEDRGEDAVCAWIQEPGSGFGQGITVSLYCSPADQLCVLAEQLQDWAGDIQVDPGRRPWPDCPDHPGSHPLMPDTRDEEAVWCCPHDGHVVAAIGMLTRPRRAG